jgi:HAD superfamily hydrolase (TIGR01549 family)
MSPRHDDLLHGIDTVILDLDGTLVDSVYQHVSAWILAFHEVGVQVPGWVIHRAIGMGGDKLVSHVAGDSVERAVGDEVRELHDQHFAEMLPQVAVLDGADALIEKLHERQLRLVLASSGNAEATDRLLDLVEQRDLLATRVTGSEVGESKPSPEILGAALERAEGSSGLVIGDSVWDVRAAAAQDLPAIGLLTGGIPEELLVDAGAGAVFGSPGELAKALGD